MADWLGYVQVPKPRTDLSHMVRGPDGQIIYNPEVPDVFDAPCAVCLKQTQHMHLPWVQLQVCRECQTVKNIAVSISSDYIDKFNPEIKAE